MQKPLLVPTVPTRALLAVSLALCLVQGGSAALAQGGVVIPAPRGHVNDFASVLTAAEVRQLEAIAQYVRAKSGGELAIVTLPDLGGRDVETVALQIGREWRVGAKAEVGDRTRNAGVVVLLVPRETNSDGNGYIRIEVGNGAEGFITDATAGRIREEGTEYFRGRRYGAGLTVITARLAERFAAEFGFSLDSLGLGAPTSGVGTSARSRRDDGPIQLLTIIMAVVVVLIISRGRGRGGCAPFILGQVAGHALGRRGRRNDWSGFGGFGGGGGGGGFGGFGGGGGFSGGGSGGRF